MAENNSSSGIKVFLHINGSPQQSEKYSTNAIRIDRNSRSDGRVELNVLFPSMVGTSEAQLAAALISDAIEQLGRNVDVEMIQLSGLRFSKGGVDGLKAALSIHAFSVKHEVLTDIDFCKKLPGDQDALAAFSSIFAAFKLSGLNLSDNTIAGCVWRFWGSQSNLKETSILKWEMRNCMGRAEAAIVSKALQYETALPWQGLRDMAHDTLHSSGRCLGHLAMEGCNLASDNIASLGLCVRVGLDDQIIKFVSLSLGSTGDCLEWLDLTGNQIGTVGAKSLACLARTPKIAKRLQYLSLENNQIDKAGAVELLDAFGRIGSNKFDLNLKGNPCDMGAVALEIAASQCYTEQQNIDLLKGRDVLRNDIQQAQKNAQN
ncbi:predicted protein [Phaeodactylum tricornutum CCAP 1055/1]|uniref:Uncharacterized protein n=2 Tax=Phaeodactylum tricornutum TaxID=2850 RepID=B7G7V7_PHATC|nr:predicted protein [Phaeodactylum tricornutum CCAP 1055/1]EEC45431.1 predicted protein [Phaeodactylum tricornutum CCAP 1055/1]|eukprot:XP_002183213.1 predicted protein [Phaeodactylum tricornutum CCAP 1055/1]